MQCSFLWGAGIKRCPQLVGLEAQLSLLWNSFGESRWAWML